MQCNIAIESQQPVDTAGSFVNTPKGDYMCVNQTPEAPTILTSLVHLIEP